MKKKYLYSILAAAFLAVVAVLFFFPDDVQGNVLQQHDIMQGLANGQEGKAFHEATGESTRWTDSLFGGMPNFQIAPSYPANGMLSWLSQAFMLWLPQPAGLLFLMMAGFFVMCLCMKMKWPTALFAAVAWGFSSYFIILIGAGHIWKFTTLAYIPPTIGGIALLYRGRRLAGAAMTALFGALQLQSNHPQMTYYFLFVVLAMVLAWLVMAIREKKTKDWGISTLLMLLSGGLALAANSASLYNSYEYSKETVRGKATDLTPADGELTGGMSRSAITAWSYGIDETFTLLVPNVKGGSTIQPVAGETHLKSVAETDKAEELNLAPEERQFLSQFPQYFGDQPMTNGPVYVGAFVLLLAVLALFMVDGPMKWALFIVSVLAVMLSWGHNFSPLTDFFIDHFPAYNKFRAVSSILVVVEFAVPLLAAMCVRKLLDDPDAFRRNPWTMYAVAGGGALICLLGWLSPSIFGEPFSASEIEQLSAAGAFSDPIYSGVVNGIRETRLSLVSGDSLRSLLFILIGCALVWLYLKGALRDKTLFTCCLTALVLIDLFSVNKRYVNHDNFTAPVENETAFRMTQADAAILRDTTNYRVLDVQGMGEALSWDGEISTALIDPSWVEPVELPETDKTGPEELVEYLGHLFDEDDVVGYVCESWDREGKWLPKSKGCYSRTAGELMRELKKYGSIEQALGSYDDRAGAWIRINPLDGKGVGNANVTEFKYALVESDTLAKEKQLALMQELQLPCAAIVDSGKKSLHAVVKVDARDYNEYLSLIHI